MTGERMKNAMQENLPEAPAGFDTRIDQLALDLAAGEVKETKKTQGLRAPLILALVMVLLLGTFTAFAATNEKVNTWLYDFWPEAATTLMPAETSSVKEGIRLELISARVSRKGRLTMRFSLEDLEGERITENTHVTARIDGEDVIPEYDYYDQKMYLTWTTDYAAHEGQEMFDLEFTMLQNSRRYNIDLKPYLEEYGSRAKLIPVRGEDIDPRDSIPETERVLDYVSGPEIRLTDCVTLSGIGITDDGMLRVVCRFPDHRMRYAKLHNGSEDAQEGQEEGGYDLYAYRPYECWITLEDRDELFKVLQAEPPEALEWGLWSEAEPEIQGTDEPAVTTERVEFQVSGGSEGLLEMEIGSPDNRMYDWKEYRFPLEGGELTQAQALYADIIEEDEPVFGMWTVHIPDRLIQKP